MKLKKHALWMSLVAVTLVAGCSSKPKKTTADIATETTDPTTYGAPSGIVSAEQAAMLNQKVFYFEFDAADLSASAQASLEAHAAYLKANSSVSARLEGHADERGTREYNMALGERRGKAVLSFLAAQGVPASQLEVVSYGEEKAAEFGHNEAAWAKNRRVELVY
jgi:peptidoglycan-associated lipoprotein